MCWKGTNEKAPVSPGMPIFDSDAEFRAFWLQQRFADEPSLGICTATFPHAFVPVARLPAAPQDIAAALDGAGLVGGVLFYHKEVCLSFPVARCFLPLLFVSSFIHIIPSFTHKTSPQGIYAPGPNPLLIHMPVTMLPSIGVAVSPAWLAVAPAASIAAVSPALAPGEEVARASESFNIANTEDAMME